MHTSQTANVLAGLWRAAGQDDAALNDVELTGAEPVCPLRLRSEPRRRRRSRPRRSRGERVLAAARGTAPARAASTCATAAIEFRSERYLRVDGKSAGRDHDRLRRPLSLRRRPLGAAPHQSAASLQRLAGLLAATTIARRYSARSTVWKAEGSKTRPPKPVSSSPRAARSPSGIASARAARSPRCRFAHRADRRRAAETTGRGRAATRRHQSPRPDPHHCRSGVRPDARGARRRRAAGDRVASAVDCGRSSSTPAAANFGVVDLREASGRDTLDGSGPRR